MSADRTAHRDVHREGQAPAPSHFDSSQLQRGASRTDHTDHSHVAANQHIENLGFPKAQSLHADHADKNFSPAEKLNPKTTRGIGAPQETHGKDAVGKEAAGKDAVGKGPADHGPERQVGKPEQPTTGDQASKRPAIMSPSDKPTTGTEHHPDGSSQSLVRDDLHKNFTGISRDKHGNVTQIQKIEQGKPAETTTYSKDGKPLSDSVKGNGERTWDEHGKLTSDTRKDKSDNHKPDALKTTKNADGTTTVKSGPGDGSSTETTFGKDGNIVSQDKNSGTGSKTHNEFSADGTLSHQQYTASDKNGKVVEQNTIDYDKQGNPRRVESTDYKGNRTLIENDENGKPLKREMEQPSQQFSRKESWDKDGYSSVTRNGNDKTTSTVKPDGTVEFKHERLDSGF